MGVIIVLIGELVLGFDLCGLFWFLFVFVWAGGGFGVRIVVVVGYYGWAWTWACLGVGFRAICVLRSL